MTKNVIRIIVSQLVYAILILEIKYAQLGFRNVEFRMVFNDLLFVVPATMSIIAASVLGYTGFISLREEFRIWRKKIEEEKKNRKKGEA